MSEEILKNLSIGVIVVSVVVGVAILSGASWYDIVSSKRARAAKKSAKGRCRQLRPRVSVIVYSKNQAKQTEVCLSSLLKSRQRKMEVVVVNNGSVDETKLILKSFTVDHPKRAIRVINKRLPGSVETVLRAGLRAASGDVLLVIGADYKFDRQALSKAADAFAIDQEVALIPATLIDELPSTLNLWLRYKNLLGLNWQKTASLLRPSSSGLHFGVFYSRRMVNNPKVDQDCRFVSDIVLKRHRAPSLSSSSATVHELAVASRDTKRSALRPLFNGSKLIYRVLALPIFTWYALYLAMNQGYSYLLFISWAIFTFTYIFVIWTSEYLAYPAKARLSALAPAVFSLATIMVFVEAVSSVLRPLSSRISKLSP